MRRSLGSDPVCGFSVSRIMANGIVRHLIQSSTIPLWSQSFQSLNVLLRLWLDPAIHTPPGITGTHGFPGSSLFQVFRSG